MTQYSSDKREPQLSGGRHLTEDLWFSIRNLKFHSAGNRVSKKNKKKNKRAMMVLNRSPEFKCSNPKPSAAELFLFLRPPFEQTQKSSTMQSSIPNFKYLSQEGLKQKIFFILPMYFYASNPGAPGVRPFWTLGHWFEQTW